jgi:hypothetical protein
VFPIKVSFNGSRVVIKVGPGFLGVSVFAKEVD